MALRPDSGARRRSIESLAGSANPGRMSTRRTEASPVSICAPARQLPLVHRADEIIGFLPAPRGSVHIGIVLVLPPAVLCAISSHDAGLRIATRSREPALCHAVPFGPSVSRSHADQHSND